MKILSVVGARPQFVKAAAVLRAIELVNKEYGKDIINSILVHTGQHYDFNMSDLFFKELALPEPDYNLGIGSGLHGEQTGRMLVELEKIYLDEQPDAVVVYGDTNSTLAGALVSAKLHIPVAHVEAGLRSFNRRMPEEINRVITDHLSSFLFCPSKTACVNLANEGINNLINDGRLLTLNSIKGINLTHQKPVVVNVGDVMVDALQMVESNIEIPPEFQNELVEKEYIVLTLHRAENVDNKERLISLLESMTDSSLRIIFPIHPRTKERISTFHLNNYVNEYPFKLIEPLGYKEMLGVVRNASLVLTDSGGLQKEAFILGVPCITLRTETEWVETVNAGWNNLMPYPSKGFLFNKLKWAEKKHSSEKLPLYGDGRASKKIVNMLLKYLITSDNEDFRKPYQKQGT